MNGPDHGDDTDDGVRSSFDEPASDERRAETDAPLSTADDSSEPVNRRAAGSPPTDPDDSHATGDDSPPAGSNAVRNWTILLVGLGLVSFLSAATTFLEYEAMEATIGASILGFGLVGAALVARETMPRLLYALSSSWNEHRVYVGFAAGLFAAGIGIGAALAAAGVDLSELLFEILMEELDGEEFGGGDVDPAGLEGEEQFELSATFFIMNNTPPFLISIAGALTLGLVTFIIMLFNGVLVGNVSAVVGAETGYGTVIALLAPHSIFELTALFIAAGVGFRFLYRLGERLLGSRDALFTRRYLAQTSLFVFFGWLMLVVAAFVEAYLTIPIAELLFPGL